MCLKVKLVSGRTLEQGCYLHEKEGEEYKRAVAICQMCEDDMRKEGIKDGDNVEVITEFGRVVVRAFRGECPSGVAFIPMGPWANSVLGWDTGYGTPLYKGVEAEIRKTDEKVKDAAEL